MNCLNKEDLQFYLDKELSTEEAQKIEMHLESCSICNEQFHVQKQEIKECLNLLSQSDLPESAIEIPIFTYPDKVEKERSFRSFKQIAASIIVIISLAGGYKIYESNSKAKYNSMELEWELNHSQSLNKQWQDREIVISITDENGKLIHLSEI